MTRAAAGRKTKERRISGRAVRLTSLAPLWRDRLPPWCASSTLLPRAIEMLRARPEERLLLVLDARGTLVGTLTWGDLYEDFFLTVVPPRLSPAPGARATRKIIRVRDLMSDPVSVTPASTLKETLALLYRHKLKGLPVVDRRGRPVGYLRLADLIAVLA